MSYDDGWAAINLETPPRVPRTEYSLEGHWGVLGAVTGIEVNAESRPRVKARARRELHRRWDFDFFWSTLTSSGELEAKRTSMGHAVYQEGGTDFNANIHCPFRDPEEALALDPWEVYGPRDRAELTRRFEEHYRGTREACPDGVNMTGIYITFVSGLIAIFGWDMLLLAAGTDPERFGRLALRYASWMQQYFDALGDAGPTDMVGYGFDPERIRSILRRDLAPCRGGHVDITLKDVETVQGDTERVRRWVEIAKEAAHEALA